MFNKDFAFKGTHAQKVINLTSKFNDKTSIFNTNIDVLIIASIVGYLYQNKANPNNEKNEEGKTVTTKIFVSELTSHQQDLYFAYRLIVLSDKKNEPLLQERLNKAFSSFYKGHDEEDVKLFEQYALGGVDILHDKLIAKARNQMEYIEALYEFIEDIQARYFVTNDEQELEEQLLKLAMSN